MSNLTDKDGWIDKARKVVAVGMYCYLASFFLVSGSQQKTLFYLVVALPAILLVGDLKHVFREHKTAFILTTSYLTYFSISSLWSIEGEFANSLKLAFVIACLMLSSYTAINLSADGSKAIRRYILAIGTLSSIFYLSIIAFKTATTDGYSILSQYRFTLHDLSGFGDGNPINSAIYFGLPILAAFWSYPKSPTKTKTLLLVLSITCLFVMFLTKSRGPIMSVIFTILLISGLRREKDDFLLLGSSFAIIGAAALIFDLLPILMDRASAPNYRVEIWTKSIALINEHLFFGQGAGESANISFVSEAGPTTVGHSHSSFLEAFRVGGLAGGILFFSLLVLSLKRSFTVSSDRGFFAFWLIYGLLCLSTNGRSVFIRPSIEWFCFWTPLFLAIFSSTQKQENKTEPLSDK